jgi:hypothetical protein
LIGSDRDDCINGNDVQEPTKTDGKGFNNLAVEILSDG